MYRSCFSALMILFTAASPALGQGLSDPLPAPTDNGFRIGYERVLIAPNTSGIVDSRDSRTRINFFNEAPDGRHFLNDLRGQLYTIDSTISPTDNKGTTTKYLDLNDRFTDLRYDSGLAAGFINFTFHPEFVTNGKFYTIHAERGQDAQSNGKNPDFIPPTFDQSDITHHTVITEWTANNPAASVFSGSSRELLRVGTVPRSYFHPFGDAQFNPNARPSDDDYGLLYISGGDHGFINGLGAGGADPSNDTPLPSQLQRLDTLAGTLIRIDPRSASETGGIAGIGDYTIPDINPFANDNDANTLGEVFAYGLRNSHRITWDSVDVEQNDGVTGSLYASDIGGAEIEEVNRIIAGGNYGWVYREGTFVNALDFADNDTSNNSLDDTFIVNVDSDDDDGDNFLYPVLQYDHDSANTGFAIAGGIVYQGSIPELQGKFIFGDIVTGRLFVSELDDIRNIDLDRDINSLVGDDPLLGSAPFETFELIDEDGNSKTLRDLVQENLGSGYSSRIDLRFGVDAEGEIYVLTKSDGALIRLVPEPSSLVLLGSVGAFMLHRRRSRYEMLQERQI